jgi:hypothetical protein
MASTLTPMMAQSRRLNSAISAENAVNSVGHTNVKSRG